MAEDRGAAERRDARRAAFRRSAAVLWQFDPDALQPDADEPAASGEVRALLRLDAARLRTARGDAWTLKDALRPPLLAGATPRALAALRARNPQIASREQALVDRWLIEADPGLAGYDFAALAVVERIAGWFDPRPVQLPSTAELARLRDRARVREPLDRLAGPRFRGRARELERLRALAAASRVVVVHGAGGTGKSTLTARAVLDDLAGGGPAEAFAYVEAYLEIDAPEQAATGGAPLIAEIARQLAAQRSDAPAMAHAAARGALTVAELARGGAGPGYALADAASTRELCAQLGAALRTAGIARVTLVLDTFEDAPYPSADRVHQLAKQLGVLEAHLPGLRAIVISRVPLALPGAAALELGALDPDAAEVYVRELGIGDADAVRAALALGQGEPLCLWLAATVALGGGALDPVPAVPAGAPVADVQTALCGQLVAQIEPPELRRLICPGLVVRRITPGIIAEVLAGPCEIARASAGELFAQLGRQAALVRCADHGALEARGEVRRLVLAGLVRDRPEVVRELHARAAAYHEARDDEAAIAEAAYHRFALGELSGPWLDRLTARAGARLRGALDELPEVTWPVVASYAGIDVPPERLSGAAAADLERRLARRLEDLLRDDRVEEALALIARSRPPRVRGSELWRWEARALRLAGRPRSALAAFERSLIGRDTATAAARADRALAVALAEQLRDRPALARLTRAEPIDAAPPPGTAPIAPPVPALARGGAPWLDDRALRALIRDAIAAASRAVAAAQAPAGPQAPAAPGATPAIAATVYATAARLNRAPRAADGSVPLKAWVDTLPGVHLHPPIDGDPDGGTDDDGLS